MFSRLSTAALLVTSARAFVAAPASNFRTQGARALYSSLSMSIKDGDKLPMGATFQVLKEGKPTDVPASDLFAGKKVVVCGVPGAMTPTCSETHLPGFVGAVEAFKKKGVDTVACVSVNDAFVMSAWGKQQGCEGKVEMLGDGGAAFAKALGLEFETGNFGGTRLKRMSMLVDDGVVVKVNVEDGGAFTGLSGAEKLMEAL